jgi:hypothetical protein
MSSVGDGDSDSDSKESTTCKAFHRFPDLPVEIRLRIWGLCCFTTIRNIALEIDIVDSEVLNFSHGFQHPLLYKYHSGTSHPSILQTSREARDEALKYYDLSFGVEYVYELANYTYSAPPHIYINWANDRLVILRPCQFWDICDHTNVYQFPINAVPLFTELLTTKKLKRLAYNCLQETEDAVAAHDDLHSLDPGEGDENLDLIYPERSSIDEVIFFEFNAEEERNWKDSDITGLPRTSLRVFVGAVDIKFLELSWEGVPHETYYPATWLSQILENRRAEGGVETMPEMRLAYVVINDEPAEPQNLGPLEENRPYII